MPKSPPTSIFTRSRKILTATAKIATKEIKQRAVSKLSNDSKLNTKIDQAKELAKLFGELKGGAMKFGQMMSLDSEDWLPEEARKILDKLQNDAPVVNSQVMLDQFFNQMKDVKIDFKSTPLAQASIGQVYKAEYNNKNIIVKIQYPNISKTITSDVSLIKPIVSNFSKVLGKKINYEETFKEVKRVLSLEVDYIREANQIKAYKEIFKEYDEFIIPEPIDEISSKNILSMSFIEGRTITEWIDSNPSMEDKEKVAHLLLKLFKIEFLKNGLVQTDPNPANFLIQEKPLRIGLIDLGASINYSKKFVQEYIELVRFSLNQNRDKVIECFMHSDLLDSRESKECIDNFIKMQFHAVRPFLKEYQSFDYSSTKFNLELKKNAFQFVSSLKYSPPPKDFIFLQRKLGGLFLILKKLGVKIDTGSYFDDIL